jgi:spermidine synthase
MTRNEKPPHNQRYASYSFFVLILFLFFVSGASGLLYQVVWTRKLVLLFGTTAYAVSAVLSVFFAGLGIGGLWGGRIADRVRNPLLVYALFEFVIAAWAVAFIFFIDSATTATAPLLGRVAFSSSAGILARLALTFAFLIVPATLMGATLPLLVKHVAREGKSLGFHIGSLYGLNTFGAMAGCAVTGFVLIERLGFTNATLVGAAGNILVGILAIACAGRTERAPKAPSIDGGVALSSKAVSKDWRGALVLLCIGLSGMCALALEVLWTRLLVAVFIGTTYAFTCVLTTVLFGIAVGGIFGAFLIDRSRNNLALFGRIELLLGLSCVLMMSVFATMPFTLDALRIAVDSQWGSLIAVKFLMAFSVMFLPTLLFGMTFPVAVQAYALVGDRLGRDVGRVYGANTLGGVVGAVLGGFVVIPLVGIHWGIILFSLVLFGIGLALLWCSESESVRTRGALTAAATVLLALLLWTAPDDMSRQFNQWYLDRGGLTALYYTEGVESTVMVTEPVDSEGGFDRTLMINGSPATASLERSVKSNRFQSVLPMVFDREPKNLLFMCFGTGVTLGTLGLFDVDQIDAVEISEDVLDAAYLFEAHNFDVVRNPKVNFVIGDGRNHLLTTEKKYDLITFEPMPLSLAGVSNFYTKEYYQLCLDRLTHGGMVSQWIPLHSLSPELIRSLVGTFADVFPHRTMWFINTDLFLVGSNASLAMDYVGAARRMAAPAVRDALSTVGFERPVDVFASFFMGEEAIDTYVNGAPIMTDDRPWAEFLAPRIMARVTISEALTEITPHMASASELLARVDFGDKDVDIARETLTKRSRAMRILAEGLTHYYTTTWPDAVPYFRGALAEDSSFNEAKFYLTSVLHRVGILQARDGSLEEAVNTIEEARGYSPDSAALHLLLANLYDELGDPVNAEQRRVSYQALIAISPAGQSLP